MDEAARGRVPAAGTASGGQSAGAAAILTVRAELDPPGETRRQVTVALIWLSCLLAAVVVSAVLRARAVDAEEGTRRTADQLASALVLGLLLPAGLTSWATHRRRRGGPHARAIVVDVLDDGQLRVWGRGHGRRIFLPGARVTERLVDVYAGRLGAWRQRRVRIEAARARAVLGGTAALELATPAAPEDDDEGLRVVGGEGDCVELARHDYERLLAIVRVQAGERSP